MTKTNFQAAGKRTDSLATNVVDGNVHFANTIAFLHRSLRKGSMTIVP